MRRGRTFIVLAIVTVAAVGAVVASRTREPATAAGSGPLFPELLGQLDRIASVTALAGGEPFNLAVRDGRWVIEEIGGYPADPNKVHQLVVGAAELRREEPKTSNPDLYPKLGLGDPGAADTESLRLSIKDPSGTPLADFTVGKRNLSKGSPGRSDFYVLVGDDPQAWRVSGRLPQGRTSLDWLAREVIEVDEERIRTVRMTHPDGEVIVASHPVPGTEDFALDSLAEGQRVKEQWRVNDIGRGLSDLELEGVAPSSKRPVPDGAGPRVELETFDGLRVTMHTASDGEETLARFEAAFDAALVKAVSTDVPAADVPAADVPAADVPAVDAPALDATAGGGDGEATMAAASTGSETGTGPLLDVDAVKAQIESLNARWDGWTYVLPTYKAKFFQVRAAELVESEAAAAAEAAPPLPPQPGAPAADQ